ncbi:hypothetical protein GTS_25990 [Gandjariella thermophila]|uniref:Uncharacterized protein n=1 Tax=Gandjariella thermophila TaxID=1931992 RepID=A0A4D4J8Z4_9PSEU|nr:hypothetical protein GTS_25990 [Gandjariella thermophila]
MIRTRNFFFVSAERTAEPKGRAGRARQGVPAKLHKVWCRVVTTGTETGANGTDGADLTGKIRTG